MNTYCACPIWGTEAERGFTDGDQRKIKSPRTGGTYWISGRAEITVKSCDPRTKARLTTWLVDQRKFGVTSPLVTPKQIELAKHSKALTVHERTDRILQFAQEETNTIGDEIDFYNDSVRPAAMAWSESTEHQEINFFLRCLVGKGWIFCLGQKSEPGFCTITTEGYARLADLEHQDSNSAKAFVAMWLDESTEEAWEKGIRPAINNASYEPVRIDQKEYANKIDDEIIAEIRRSRFLVADFTHGENGVRGSVYYETGFAHGLDIPVIFSCRSDLINEIHFDTRQYNHIAWKTPEELREALEKRISAVLGDGPQRTER